ncbi:hypothetical protein Tco_0134882 [Tanacetum coccineum]
MADSNVPKLVDKKGGNYSATAPRLKVDDIMEPVINCETFKDTWTDLVHANEGPSDSKENRIMDLNLEYNTFIAKDSESLSQTFTRYKTLLNKLTNDGVKRIENEAKTVKVLMALPKDEKIVVGKSHAINSEQVNITMRKVNLLLSINKDSD